MCGAVVRPTIDVATFCPSGTIKAMERLRASLAKLIATVFYVGYIPVAPGTFGSLAGMGLVWALRPDTPLLLCLWLAVFILGVWSAHEAEKAFQQKDCGCIVIDEVSGYLTSVLFLPLTPGFMIAALCLFRLLDITKPPPIRNVERSLKGGLGVMMDDVVAGIGVNLILQLWRLV
ncbi:MAG: phosphatidylglycerophosphatase A [Nitrospirales bacterium]|nr:phosphatidylglycerophosphatase A [Nitrospirales bacterium]